MSNAEQSAHWNQAAGPRWATLAERTDKLFGGVTAALLKSAGASECAFDPQRFDLLLSQLGGMFFDDPVRAFRNLYGAVRPGGRLRVACFRSLAEDDWFSVPLAAARKMVALPPPGDPTAPGPTSLADPDHLRTILRAAGFGSIELHPLNVLLPAGTRAEAVELFFQVGALPRALAGRSADEVATVKNAVGETLRDYESSGQVELGAGLWLVSALA